MKPLKPPKQNCQNEQPKRQKQEKFGIEHYVTPPNSVAIDSVNVETQKWSNFSTQPPPPPKKPCSPENVSLR